MGCFIIFIFIFIFRCREQLFAEIYINIKLPTTNVIPNIQHKKMLLFSLFKIMKI
jgi:hypothetical protein